jgi:MFS family permease
MAMYGMGQTVLYAIFPPLGRDLGLSPPEIGLITALAAMTATVVSAPWGRISDRWGRRPVIIVGLVAYAVTNLSFIAILDAGRAGYLAGMPLLAGLIGARVLFGAGTAGIQPAAAAYMADLSGQDNRTAAMAVIGMGLGLGMVLGPVLAAALVSLGLLAPLYATVLMTLAMAAVTYFMPSPDMRNQQRVSPPLRLSVRRFAPFMMLSLGTFLGLAVLQQTISFLVQDRLVLSSADAAERVGIVLTGFAIAMLATQVFVGRAKRLDPLWLLRIAMIVFVVGFTALAFADSLASVAGVMLVLGIGTGLATPSLLAAASVRAEAHDQGTVAGIMSAVPPLAFVLGPLLGTSLYTVSPALPFEFLALVSAGMAALSFVLSPTPAGAGH